MVQVDRQVEVRVMLASMGLLSASIAWLSAALAPPAWEHCLQTAAGPEPHCAACYVAAVLFAAAIAPWPRALLRVRP